MKISVSAIFWSFVSVAIGLIFLAGSWGSYAEFKRVQDYEGRAIGHITHKQSRLGSDGGGNYFIEYWFMSSAGVKISASSTIAKQQWDMLKVNDTLEMRYDKSNPYLNIPMYGGSPSLVFAFFMLVLSGVLILFGTLRLMNSLKKSSRRKSA